MRWIKTLFVHIQQWRQIYPFEVVVKEPGFQLLIGQKSQFFFLQKKVKGHVELLGSEGGAWLASQWLTDVNRGQTTPCDYKWGGGLYHCHCKSQLTPSPLRGTCGEYCPLLWQKQWVSLSATFTLTRRPGCILQGAQAKCGPPLPPIPSSFTSMWRGSLTGTLSLPWDSSARRVGGSCSRVTSNLVQIVSKLLF